MDTNIVDTLPWIESFRPKSFDDIIGNEQNIKTIRNMLKNGSLPHLLFHGTSGTGKTSLILTIAKELYGNNVNLMVMKLDASDDRGINSVREEIKGFADKKNMFYSGIKLIILDEADSMTFDAQFALRRIIEKYSNNTRFCLICNYENKIIPAIRSRCASFRFSPISKERINEKLKYICNIKNINYTDDCLDIISTISDGDLRKSINLLQSISMKTNDITIDVCYESAGLPNNETITYIYDMLFDINYNFMETYNILKKIIKDNSYSLNSIIKEIFYKILDNNLNPELIVKLAELENKLSKTTFIDIYVSSFIAIFK